MKIEHALEFIFAQARKFSFKRKIFAQSKITLELNLLLVSFSLKRGGLSLKLKKYFFVLFLFWFLILL